MKKLYIKTFKYQDKQREEYMLFAYALEDSPPVIVDLFHGERIPENIRRCFMDKRVNIYTLSQYDELGTIIKILRIKTYKAYGVDLYKRLNWVGISNDLSTIAEMVGAGSFPCSYIKECIERFNIPNSLLERRIIPDEYPSMWNQIKEYLKWIIRIEKGIVEMLSDLKQRFPYEEIPLNQDKEIGVVVEQGKSKNDKLYIHYQEWCNKKEPQTMEEYADYLRNGYMLVRELQQKIKSFRTVGDIREKVLVEYEALLPQIVMKWAGEKFKMEDPNMIFCVFGNGITGYFKWNPIQLNLTEEEIRQRINKWNLRHPLILSFWDSFRKGIWYVCNTHKIIQINKMIFSWKYNSLFITLPSGRGIFFPRAELFYKRKQWLLSVVGIDAKGRKIRRYYFISEILEFLAVSAVEEIIVKKAVLLKEQGVGISCVSKTKILCNLEKKFAVKDKQNYLVNVLKVKEEDFIPVITYGGCNGTNRWTGMDEIFRL